MRIFNIQTKTEHNLSTAAWDTGNSRSNIIVQPMLGISNYTTCNFDFFLTGNSVSTTNCRFPTEALHGSQPSPDIMINNIITEKDL